MEGDTHVDPLSLIASLRDHPDERVQLALKDFEGKLVVENRSSLNFVDSSLNFLDVALTE